MPGEWAVVSAWERFKDADPQKKKRILLLGAVGALLMAMVMSLGMLKFTSRPNFCVTCHEMKPEYQTWQTSSHSKVSCVTCHIKPGPVNFVKKKVEDLNQLRLHVTNRVPENIRMPEKIENEVCESCHTTQRAVTASGDIKIPHAKHIEVQGLVCVDCHFSVVHAGVARNENNQSKATPQLMAKLAGVDAKSFRPSMVACIQCHNLRNGPITCGACHKEIKTPKSHQTEAWKFGHGSEAVQSWNECLFCHDIALGQPPVTQVRDLQAIQDNQFCLNCHLKRPPAHDSNWYLGHRRPASQDKTPCFVCHDQKKTPGSKVGTTISCDRCHTANHPSDWGQQHPNVVKKDGMVQCFTCHQAKSCGDCHEKNGVHANI